MEKYKSYELQNFINTVYEAVNKSDVGSVYERDAENNIKLNSEGYPNLNNLAYNTFLYLLNSLAPKNFSGNWNFDGKFTERQENPTNG